MMLCRATFDGWAANCSQTIAFAVPQQLFGYVGDVVWRLSEEKAYERHLISLVARPCLVTPSMHPRSPLFPSILDGTHLTSCFGWMRKSKATWQRAIGTFLS